MLVVAAGLGAYSNSFHDVFVFDDRWHIVDNPHIRQLWPPWEILTHSSRPVVHLSLALNYALGALNPWGYHAFNLVIHLLAALVLYGVVHRTFLSEPLRSRWAGASAWLAAAVALIWVVHPLQTEAVTYVIQRGECLMGLFYLLTLYCAIRSNGSPLARWWIAGAVLSCVLGIASKEVIATAPVVVLLYDRVFLARSWREVMQRRGMLYAGLAATLLLVPVLMANGPAEVPGWQPTAGFGYKGITPEDYLLTQGGVILHYLRLVFWPYPLCLDYGWGYGWPVARTISEALPGLLIVGGLAAAAVWAWRRKPALAFVGAWFFIILAPTSSFVPIADLVFEHRMYLSLAAVIVLAVVFVYRLGERLLGARRQLRQVLGGVVTAAVVVPLAGLTFQRNRDYRSEFAIWQDTAAKCPNNPRAYNALGNLLIAEKKYQEALPLVQQALRIKPNYPEANCNMGLILAQTGKVADAISHFNEALSLNPSLVDAHNNLGLALMQAGRVAEAIGHYEEALRIRPDYAESHYNLAIALEQTGRTPEAISHYEEALRLKPDYAEAHSNLGLVLLQEGRTPEAISHFEQAVRFNPDLSQAHFNWASALARTGNLPEAISHYREALRLKPDYEEAHYNLGVVLFQAGKVPEAVAHFEEALRISPDDVGALSNLAWVLAALPPAQGGDPARAVTLAKHACELTANGNATYLNTLAIAYAAANRFGDAADTAQKAIDLARSAGQTQLAGQIEAQLAAYRAHH